MVLFIPLLSYICEQLGCGHVCVCSCMCICVHVCVVCIVWCVCRCPCVFMHVFVSAYVFVVVYVCCYVHVPVHVWFFMCLVCMYVFVFMHMSLCAPCVYVFVMGAGHGPTICLVLHSRQSSRDIRKMQDSWGFWLDLWRFVQTSQPKDWQVHLPSSLSCMCTFQSYQHHPGHFGKCHTLLSGWKERSPWKSRVWITW